MRCSERVDVEQLQERVVVEGSGRKGEDEEDEAADAEDGAGWGQIGDLGDFWMAQRGDEEKDAPEDPADPVDGSGEEEEEGQDVGQQAMQARGERVEDMAAVELAAGDEIERGDEEADPAGNENGMRRGLIEGGDGGVPVGKKMAQQADGERIASKANEGLRCTGCAGRAEHEADGNCEGGGDEAGERTVDSYIHESVACGDAGANANDGAEGSAERGSGDDPGQGGAEAVRAASRVVAEFVNEENAEQSERVGETREEESGVAKEPAPGPEIALARDGRKTAEEVVHELRAVHGGGDDAGEEKQRRQAIFSKQFSRQLSKRGKQPDLSCGANILTCPAVGSWGRSTREFVIEN